MRNSCICLCGGISKLQVGEVWHIIKDKRILVHNVPHYLCSICGEVGYDSNVRLMVLLKQAYNQNLEEITYVNN